jgi:hypothetical protein
MSTFFIYADNGFNYEIQHIGLSIFVLKENKRLTRLADVPEDVQEAIVKRITDSVVKQTDNPYETF